MTHHISKTSHRSVYSYQDLKRLIDPASVAIVGLSRKETSFGARAAFNLRHFSGTVFGINPSADEIHGIQTFSSLRALPMVPDCAVIAVPVDAVEVIVEECAAAGVGGCVIFASGFADRLARSPDGHSAGFGATDCWPELHRACEQCH